MLEISLIDMSCAGRLAFLREHFDWLLVAVPAWGLGAVLTWLLMRRNFAGGWVGVAFAASWIVTVPALIVLGILGVFDDRDSESE